MKIAIVFLFVGLVVVWFIWTRLPVTISTKTVDIRVHDTKMVVGFFQLALLILLFLGTLFFLGGFIETRFTRKGFTIPLVIFLIADLVVAIEIIKLFRHIYN